MRIGELAREFGLSVPTLRYYDAIKLVKPATVDPPSRYRRYDDGARRVLRFIRSAKTLGFSLREIASILRAERSGSVCGKVSDAIDEKLVDVRGEIRRLQRLEKNLTHLRSLCRTARSAVHDRTCVCPVVEGAHAGAPNVRAVRGLRRMPRADGRPNGRRPARGSLAGRRARVHAFGQGVE